VILALALATIAYGTATLAQDRDRAKAGLTVWRSSGCADFRGREREDDEYPAGANLRTSRIEGAALKMTISCGRPGTGMPSFDEGACTVRACCGRDNLQPTPLLLNPDEIDAVTAYLKADVIGRGKITREECLYYYDDKPDWCEDYNNRGLLWSVPSDS
jgi:hypothetical protein